MKELFQKALKSTFFLTVITIFFFILFLFLFSNFYKSLSIKIDYENSVLDFAKKNSSKVFSIDKIVFFSSCDCKNKNNTISNYTLENLYSYTDIALFINNTNVNDLEHSLKSLKLTNIKISKLPELGTPKLCFKPLNNFAKNDNIDTSIDSELEFEISDEDSTDLSTPKLYNNCANPITLSYINENIKTDYTIVDTGNPVTYDGSLLQRCFIPLTSLTSSVSFDIYIENNKDEKFKTSVFLDIPYEDNGTTIYSGNLTLKKNTNILFYRYD